MIVEINQDILYMTDDILNKSIWWEKTVEYNFVLNSQKDYNLNLLTPLDGHVESIGDAVVGENNNFYIIEFKKTLENFNSEYKKYNGDEEGFNKAKENCKKLHGWEHHFVIGGTIEKLQEKVILQLDIKRYFDVDNSNPLDKKELFQNGMSKNELSEYTSELTKFKKRNSESSSSSNFQSSFVLAVSNDKKAHSIPLDYYINLVLKPKPEKKQKNNLGL